MGGSPIGIEVNYKRGNSIAFEYSAVYQDNIEVAALDQYLGSADINPYSRYGAKHCLPYYIRMFNRKYLRAYSSHEHPLCKQVVFYIYCV
jgi:hypothetical protein